MIEPASDVVTTLFLLPPDAKFLPVSELAPRLRARIGPVEEGQSVITRPGFRVTTRLVPAPLADLISEFRVPSLLTDAVSRFASAHDQDPFDMLDLAFDALAALVEARILVPEGSPDAAALTPSLAVGQELAGFEIEALVRSLEDTEVYRAQGPDGAVALKIARDDRPHVKATLANEAHVLELLDGVDSPKLVRAEIGRERPFIAMEWCDGVSIAVAAQQARAARDRRRLHGIVGRMLDAYGRLHERGVLHGDIHPGNCFVRDDGRIVILDFGNARPIESGRTVDPLRSGIPQFYDPDLAAALLERRLPPAATRASEQYAIAVLAYLLLTGLQPIDAPFVHDELLRRIVERPPLPFAARGVPSWPEVEDVVRRGLARRPADRFPDVTGFARAFSSSRSQRFAIPRWPDSAQRAFDTAVENARMLIPFADPLAEAWFALRAALVLEDAELLAAAEILIGRAGTDPAAQAVAALAARARSDTRAESRAVAAFLAEAERMRGRREVGVVMRAAASILEGVTSRSSEVMALAAWAARRLDELLGPSRQPEPLLTQVALALAKTGAAAVQPDLRSRLEALRETNGGDVWLWALAHDVFADDQYKALALAARLPSRPLTRALAMLRLHQLTGDMRWIADAARVVRRAPSVRLPALDTALLLTELRAPEWSIAPPFPWAADRAAPHEPLRRRVSPEAANLGARVDLVAHTGFEPVLPP